MAQELLKACNLSSIDVGIEYGFELTINGNVVRSLETVANTAYHKSTAINNPVASVASVGVRVYLTLTSTINGYVGITLGNLQLQSGIVPTRFIDNNTPFAAMYTVSGSNIVLSNPLPALDTILVGFSGSNNVTKEVIDTFSGTTYATINEQRFNKIGISDGVTTTYRVVSPELIGTSNLIMLVLNPYTAEDYFTTYTDGISQYTGTPTITTE
jgi:hypothetical protein